MTNGAPAFMNVGVVVTSEAERSVLAVHSDAPGT